VTLSFRRLACIALAVVLPPLVAIGLRYGSFLATEGEGRCADSLDPDTPGLVCTPGVELLADAVLTLPLHLFLLLPASWLAWRRLRLSRRKLFGASGLIAGTVLAPVASYRWLGVLPLGGELILLLGPIALCPTLAMLTLSFMPPRDKTGPESQE